MIFDGTGIEVDAFCSAEKTGSPQILHLFTERGAMHSAFEKTIVSDEWDHSFVYFEAPERALVYWKNKACPIQFCGSAAYALAWLALTQFAIPALRITSPHISTTAVYRQGAVEITVPSQKAQQLLTDSDGSLFFNAENGVYLLNASEPIERIDQRWLAAYMHRKQLKNAHGFCVFAWRQDTCSGEVRYFAPWYGRAEDYVTGSIHQYLTPLVYEYFSVREQTWHQLSAIGGCLYSRYDDARVLLSGQCRLGTEACDAAPRQKN